MMLAAALPLVALIAFLVRFAVDVPLSDQWEFLPLVDRMFGGTFEWRDVWVPWNEHRLVFPRLVMLALARLSHWNTLWEIALDVGLAAAIAAILIRRLHLAPLGASVAAVIVFSLVAWENWLWGWQIQIFMNVLSVVIGLALLDVERLSYRHIGGAVVLGNVALYSFGNGIVFWPIGAGLLLIRRAQSGMLLVFLIGIVASVTPYLVGYAPPAHHPVHAYALHHPLAFVTYVLAYLGRVLTPIDSVALAALCGAIGLLAYAGFAIQSLRGVDATSRRLRLPLALGGYAILSAALTGVARVGLGTWQALSSRYASISMLLWVALIACFPLLPARRARGAALALGLVAALASLHGAGVGAFSARRYAAGRAALLAGRTDDLANLFPDPGVVIERSAVLKARGLSCFRR